MRKKLERLDTQWGRAYVLAEDNLFKFLPSVTTVLSLFSSPKLHELEEKLGKETFAQVSLNGATRGTAMHKFAENYVISLKKSYDHEKSLLYTQRKSTDELLGTMEKQYVDKGRNLFYNMYHEGLFRKVKKVLLSEGFLYSEKYLFAGAVDFVFLDTGNCITVVDFKSAGSPKEWETIHKYQIQGSAYALAFTEMYSHKVDRIEIWISYPDGIQKIVVEGEEMNKRKREFIEFCKQYHEMWEVDKIREFYLNKSTHN